MEITRNHYLWQKYILAHYALGALISVQAAVIAESSSISGHLMISASPTPTPTEPHIVPGSTMSIATSGVSPDLTGLDLSPLYGSATPTPNAPLTSYTMLTISQSASIGGCGQSGCSSSSRPTATPTASSDALNASSGLSTGAIAGITAGSGVLVIFALLCVWRAKRSKPKFDRGRGITPSMFFDNQPNLQPKDGSSDRLSAYSFTSPNAAFGYSPQPLSEKTTAMLDQMYNIKQYNNPTTQTLANNAPAKSTARLSKYNYLTQVFSQMRASTGQDPQPQSSAVVRQMREKETIGQPEMTSGPDRTLHESTVLGPHQPEEQALESKSIVEVSKLNFSNTRFGTVPAISVSPPPNKPNGPYNSQYQQPPRIAVYNEHDEQKEIIDPYRGMNGRDSMMSEVSQYSTFSTDTNPFRASTGSADSVTVPYIPQQPQPVVHSQRYEYI